MVFLYTPHAGSPEMKDDAELGLAAATCSSTDVSSLDNVALASAVALETGSPSDANHLPGWAPSSRVPKELSLVVWEGLSTPRQHPSQPPLQLSPRKLPQPRWKVEAVTLRAEMRDKRRQQK